MCNKPRAQDLKNIDDPVDKRKRGRASAWPVRHLGSWSTFLKNHNWQCGFYGTSESIDSAVMFEIIRKYHRLGCILSASGASGKDGLVTGHAYSILNVRKVNDGFMGMTGKDFRMVQIRNPWGRGEWKGDWSDKSSKWEEHPAVKKALEYVDKDDG
eukprot:Skav234884  [mRNA]  locus=scaffold840:429099:435611:- [translate_table: standard]